jgi:hypothetical protein
MLRGGRGRGRAEKLKDPETPEASEVTTEMFPGVPGVGAEQSTVMGAGAFDIRESEIWPETMTQAVAELSDAREMTPDEIAQKLEELKQRSENPEVAPPEEMIINVV